MVLIRLLALALGVSRVVALSINGTNPGLGPARVYESCIMPNTVALTFDDGPYIYIKEIVDMLNHEKANGTFFFNGLNWGCIYSPESVDRVQYAYRHGHLIGSHTWAHKDLLNITYEEIHDEMYRTELAIQRITGALVSYMRPPYGSYNQTVLEISGMRNQSVVTWDFDSGDTLGNATNRTQTLDDLIQRKPASILSVFHETQNTTVNETLPYAIRMLKSKGYKLVTVAECLNLTAYQNITVPETRNSNWTC